MNFEQDLCLFRPNLDPFTGSTTVKRLKRFLLRLIYYCGVRYLPPSYSLGGQVWRYFRYIVCRHLFSSCGKNVNIESRAYFEDGRRIRIGDNSGIGVNARLNGTVIIGDNVMMGQDVAMFSINHEFSRIEIPMIHQGFQEDRPVRIGDDVWIGDRAIILPGVRVGNGVVIGAGAVVAKDIPDWAVVIGNPARVVRLRKQTAPREDQNF